MVSARTLDPRTDGQLPIIDSDFAAVDEMVKADPGWRAAMARRGLKDLSKIRACPITAGAFGPATDDRRRMVRVLAFVQDREHDLAWAHPVDGLAAYVDLIEQKVFRSCRSRPSRATMTMRRCAARTARRCGPSRSRSPRDRVLF